MNCRSESRKRRMTLQQHYPGGSPTWKKIGQPCSCIAICGMYIESLNHCKIFLTQTMRIRSIPSATMNSEKNRFWPIIAKSKPTLDAVGEKPTASVVSRFFNPWFFISHKKDVNSIFQLSCWSRTRRTTLFKRAPLSWSPLSSCLIKKYIRNFSAGVVGYAQPNSPVPFLRQKGRWNILPKNSSEIG